MIQVIIFIILLFAILVSLLRELIMGIQWIIKRLRNAAPNKTRSGLKRNASVTGVLLAAMFGLITISHFTASTPSIKDNQGKILPGSIAELRKVELNGRQEWISIRGENRNNPILLFLVGGPGGTQMAACRYNLKGLEKSFVVVNWDQPGSGKSYYAVNQKSLTADTYIQDGYALTKYLCNSFGKKKIYLVGESWGSALGILLAEKHPELYHAFIGTGQMVDFTETEKLDYEKALEIARAKNDNKKIAKLKANGIPPYYGSDVTWKSTEYLNYLNAYMDKNPEIQNPGFNTFKDIFSPEYDITDKINYIWGLIKTFNHVYPQLYNTDLRKGYTKIKIPVYFFIGRHDINAPSSLVEDYYKILDSPHKEIVWFEHSGHSPWINESDKFVKDATQVAQCH